MAAGVGAVHNEELTSAGGCWEKYEVKIAGPATSVMQKSSDSLSIYDGPLVEW